MTLHYLWGFAMKKTFTKNLIAMGSHSRRYEEVFESFVDMLMDKFSEDPKMHIFRMEPSR